MKIISMVSGIQERIFFSMTDNRNTPRMTDSTPPFPVLSTEFRGFCSSYRPSSKEIWLIPSMEVIMPSIPPRIGVAPKRSAARYPAQAVR